MKRIPHFLFITILFTGTVSASDLSVDAIDAGESTLTCAEADACSESGECLVAPELTDQELADVTALAQSHSEALSTGDAEPCRLFLGGKSCRPSRKLQELNASLPPEKRCVEIHCLTTTDALEKIECKDFAKAHPTIVVWSDAGAEILPALLLGQAFLEKLR